MEKNKKGNIGVNTVFFIMMGMLFVVIIGFGINKLFFVQDTMSEQDRILFKNELTNELDRCIDPLNSGNVFYKSFNNKQFNILCQIGGEMDEYLSNYNLPTDDINTIYNSGAGENVILIKASIGKDNITQNAQIIDKLTLERKFKETTCFFYSEKTRKLTVEIKC